VPRHFDSAENQSRLVFAELVDCPACTLVFGGVFTSDATELDDIVETPTGAHVCPGCGHAFVTELTGWTFYTEAG